MRMNREIREYITNLKKKGLTKQEINKKFPSKKFPELNLETYKRYVRDIYKDNDDNNKKKEIVSEQKQFEKSSFVKSLKNEIEYYKTKLKESDNVIKNILLSSRQSKPYIPIRDWTPFKGERVAIVQLFDWHYSEVVMFEDEFKNLNRYDKDIAKKRAQYVFDKIVEFCTDNDIMRIIVLLGGDMVNGIIHEELKYNIDSSLMNDAFGLSDVLAYNINKLANEFQIKVIGVSGNHGRLNKKIEHKFKGSNNFDYMVYKIVQGMCPNVNFEVSETTNKVFCVNGEYYAVHHGDYARGGKNITGAPSFTAARESSFMSNLYKQIGKEIKAIFFGHFHTDFSLPGLNVRLEASGSLMGVNSYAKENNFTEPASQKLVIIEPNGEISIRYTINVNHIMN